MINFIIIFILALIFAFAIGYIIREKKKGAKCVGCPYAKSCEKNGVECNSDK